MSDLHITAIKYYASRVQVLDLNGYGEMLEGATVFDPIDGHEDILVNAQLAGGEYIYAVQSIDADRVVVIRMDNMDTPAAGPARSADTRQNRLR